MNLEALGKLKRMVIPMIGILVVFFIVFRIIVPKVIIQNEEVMFYLPLISVVFTIMTINFTCVMFSFQWITRSLEMEFKPILVFIPFIKSLYFVQLFSEAKRQFEDFKSLNAISLLPFVAELLSIFSIIRLAYNLKVEGLEYMTVEVEMAFLMALATYILLSITRYLIVSLLMVEIEPYTDINGSKKYLIFWFLELVLWLLYFIAQMFFSNLASILGIKIFNIILFILPISILPIITHRKLKKVCSDLLYEKMQNEKNTD